MCVCNFVFSNTYPSKSFQNGPNNNILVRKFEPQNHGSYEPLRITRPNGYGLPKTSLLCVSEVILYKIKKRPSCLIIDEIYHCAKQRDGGLGVHTIWFGDFELGPI